MTMVFGIALAVIIYTYVGYPLLVFARAVLWNRPYRKEPITPAVTLIVACHDEEAVIAEKLRNLLSLDYPRPKLQIIIASDGSTDATEEIVQRYSSRGVHLLRLPRCGKAAALNAAVQQATGDVLLFSDANSIFAVDAVQRIVQPFADPTVGGVAGNQRYRTANDSDPAAFGEDRYWNWDRLLKIAQSRAGSVISATGAIYAVRRSLYRNIPDGVTDDFVNSTRVVAHGYRLVFEPRAVCYEPVAGEPRGEFRRKTRIITRGLRGVFLMRELLNPLRYGFYAVQLFSHKVLRRLVAFALLILLVTTPLLWTTGWFFQMAAVLQAVFYGFAVVGLLLTYAQLPVPKFLSLPFYFCLVNFSVFCAVYNLLAGRRIDRWEPQRNTCAVADEATPGAQLRETGS